MPEEKENISYKENERKDLDLQLTIFNLINNSFFTVGW